MLRHSLLLVDWSAMVAMPGIRILLRLAAFGGALAAPALLAADFHSPDHDPVAEAEEALTAAVERAEHADPAHPTALATSLRNLGVFYHTRERRAEARALLERALAVQERADGADPLETVTLLYDLAMVYAADGDDRAARKAYERALRLQRRAFGPDDVRTARTLNNLATLYARQGKLRRAARLHEREIEILARAFGEDSIRLVSALERLARIHSERGDAARAESAYRRAITLAEESDAPASERRLLSLLEGYAALLGRLPDREHEAELLALRAAELGDRPLGADRRALPD